MALATLSVDLIAKVAGFEQELKRVADSTTRQANAMAGAMGVVRASLAGLGAAFSAGAIVSFVRATNDGIDALNDLKDATGASIENISALEDVADRTGTSFETVGAALVKFNAALNDAKPGSTTSEALKAIGLDAEELKRIDPAEALRRTAVALGDFADDGNKARLVQELFGRSIREVAPLLNDLKERGELVAKVTTQQAEEAEKFNKQLFEMQKNAKDAARALVSDLVEGINKAAKAWRESGLVSGIQMLLTGDDEYKNNKRLVELTNDLLQAENTLSQARARDAQYGDRSLATAAAEKRVAALKEELKTVQAYRQVMDDAKPKATSAADAPSVGSGWSAEKKKPEAEQIDEARRALAGYVNTLQGNLDTANKLTETEKALNFLRGLGVQGEIPQVRALVLELANELDLRKQITEEEADYAAVTKMNRAARNDIDRARSDRLKGLMDATPGAKLEEQRTDVRLLTEEFEAGRLSEEQYLEAVSTRLNLTAADMKNNKSIAEELGMTFSSAAEDAILNWRDLGEVIQGVGRDMARIVVRKSVTEPLADTVSDFAKGIQWKELFGFASGGVMTANGPLPLRAYASGGIARSPQLAVYGEGSMAEAFVPLPDGRSIPVTMQGGGGGGNIVVNVIESPGNGGQVNRRSEGGADIIDVMVDRVAAKVWGDVGRGNGPGPAVLSNTYGLNRVAGAY